MSLRKKWTVQESDEFAVSELSSKLGLYEPVAAILVNRGYGEEKEAKKFINKENGALYDAFLLPDMDKAAERMIDAVNNEEKIAVYGDYDVDGITGTSVIYLYLRSLGADVSYYIPDRVEEGYGINKEALLQIRNGGVSLVVTVDTGITAIEEAEYAREIGLDLVITDHHECRDELPRAVAAVNPKRGDSRYPFRELAGVGVAFKLISACAYYSETGETVYSKEYEEEYISIVGGLLRGYSDLVALGTVADVMPLKDENRVIVSYGLHCMEKTSNIGLRALLEASDVISHDGKAKKITASTVGYILAPRINAAGRISKATRAVELFLTSDKRTAESIADELCETNKKRQEEENKIAAEAVEMIETGLSLSEDKILILAKEGWHHGVVGIVSSRITERYNLPSILISFDPETNLGKGSGRSISEFNLVEALEHCGQLLDKFGGHTLAAGLTVSEENFPKFKAMLTEYANSHISDEDAERKAYADREIYAKDVNVDLIRQLGILEPYGASNPTPVFYMRDLQITEITPISMGKHLRISFLCDGEYLQAMYFGTNKDDLPFTVDDKVDILCNLTLNEFKGQTYPRIIVKDMRFAHEQLSEIEAYLNLYEDIRSGFLLAEDKDIPSREDCAVIFRTVTAMSKNAKQDTVLDVHKASVTYLHRFSFVKLLFVIEIFSELNFLNYHTKDGVIYKIKMVSNPKKVSLTDSPLFNYLNGHNDGKQ